MKRMTAMVYLILIFVLTGCASSPEKQARRGELNDAVKKVYNISGENEKEKYDCKFISLETVGSGSGFTTAGDMSKAVKKSKIVTARKGGNATKFLMSSSTLEGSSVTFEVLKCNKLPLEN